METNCFGHISNVARPIRALFAGKLRATQHAQGEFMSVMSRFGSVNGFAVSLQFVLVRVFSGSLGALACGAGMALAFLPGLEAYQGLAMMKSMMGGMLFLSGLLIASTGAKIP